MKGKPRKKKAKAKPNPIPIEEVALLTHKIETYTKVSSPQNTEKAYLSDIDCYLNWGGPLPAKPIDIARYLVAHAEVHNVRTLRRRKSMLGKWHRNKNLSDPTKDSEVVEAMKGISRIHNAPPSKVKPLSLGQLARIHKYLERKIESNEEHSPSWRKALRDRAMLTVGFWGCLRSDELVNIKVKHVKMSRHSITIYNPHTKTDKEVAGREKQLSALPKYCPVAAVRDYINQTNPRDALFPSMAPNGELGLVAMRSRSVAEWLKVICKQARVQSKGIGSHSLRRGFATWYAMNSGGDMWGLMAAGDWASLETAAGYVDHKTNTTLIKRLLRKSNT